MDKSRTAEELRKRGYECSVDSGVVMIRGHKDSQLLSALKKELNEIGYTGSFGMHMAKSGIKLQDGNSSETDSEDDAAEPTEEEIARDIVTFDGADNAEPGIDYESDGQETFNL